jgi:hypothetical protein
MTTHDPDATARALEHDIEVLEEKAKTASVHLAKRVAPVAVAVLVLLAVAWILGRRTRKT